MLGKCQSLGSAILVVAVLFSFLVFFFVVNCCCCCLSLDILKKSKVKQDTKKKNKKETYSTYRQNSEGHNERTLTHLVTWQRHALFTTQ